MYFFCSPLPLIFSTSFQILYVCNRYAGWGEIHGWWGRGGGVRIPTDIRINSSKYRNDR